MSLSPHIYPPTLRHFDTWLSLKEPLHLNSNHSRFPGTAVLEDITLNDPFAAIHDGERLSAAIGCQNGQIRIHKAKYVFKAPMRSSEVVFCSTSSCTVTSSFPSPFDTRFYQTPPELQPNILDILNTSTSITPSASFPGNIKTSFNGPDKGFQIFYPLYFEIKGDYNQGQYAGKRQQRTIDFTLAVPSITSNGTINGFFKYQTICTPLLNKDILQDAKTNTQLFNFVYMSFCNN
ncbi:hypothetical protein DSO57_1015230 [Entomophthora muscae]|uniref:Uncharacterized protein n=1 Tax=Entomophthora muscae TaxID=34485 RepID=A0ACC2TSF8_9FUNG|nr:hypothetical protein DSO57_1015230 [Entomophthora muscae]